MFKKRQQALIDERNYSVVGINGFRRGGLTLAAARELAERMREQMRQAGWAGAVRVFYRDGTEVSGRTDDARRL